MPGEPSEIKKIRFQNTEYNYGLQCMIEGLDLRIDRFENLIVSNINFLNKKINKLENKIQHIEQSLVDLRAYITEDRLKCQKK